jgi:sulfate/thiosulfate-binding protein
MAILLKAQRSNHGGNGHHGFTRLISLVWPCALFIALLLPQCLKADPGCCMGVGNGFDLDSEWQSADGEGHGQKTVSITSLSLDITRNLYLELGGVFAEKWAEKTGYAFTLSISTGSGSLASLIDAGSQAEVVTGDWPGGIDALSVGQQLLPPDWRTRLERNSAPYGTSIVFLVRKGNPKKIKDWEDLLRPDVSVMAANPKRSGQGRWAYLAAWGYAQRTRGGPDQARDFVGKLYGKVPELHSTYNGTAAAFKKGRGDVLLAWESEAHGLLDRAEGKDYAVVSPSQSILAEIPVTWLDTFVDRHGTKRVTLSFAKFLYRPEVQEIIAQHYFRPCLGVQARLRIGWLPKMEIFSVQEVAGGTAEADRVHFSSGGIFDQIFQPAKHEAVALPLDENTSKQLTFNPQTSQ